ncbi:hypothetical protein [Phytoactinopolyspora halophila]|uniref:hypothetical protein n=1 Tax=Phytoactinopolyspora halophila TaxID=1981511 RepID=UPI001B8C0565|nr:hypothetical protein [Phytoactinopolyspora halophila]
MGTARRQRTAAALASVSGAPVGIASENTVGAASDDTGLPVLPALQALIPALRPGQTMEIDDAGGLALALLAGPSRAGSWCGIVGVPDCGIVAASELGCDLDRLLLVDEPGERWADVVATLLEAVDVVLLRPPTRPQINLARRLVALARTSGAVLLVAGAPWEGSAARLRIESSLWLGVEQGHGHLRSRRVKAVAEGRLTGGRPRSAWLWLPGSDGSVSDAGLAPVPDLNTPDEHGSTAEHGSTDGRTLPAAKQTPSDPAALANPNASTTSTDVA